MTVCKSPCGFSLDISMKMPAALGTLRRRGDAEGGQGGGAQAQEEEG